MDFHWKHTGFTMHFRPIKTPVAITPAVRAFRTPAPAETGWRTSEKWARFEIYVSLADHKC
jgi:hypothetical protein